MIDDTLRRYIDPPLNRTAAAMSRIGITANQVTIGGFIIGLLSVPLLALQQYDLAIAAILLNRLCDGLDGAVARQTTPTDLGGYLDIVLDFIFYSGVIFGFVLGRPEQAVYGAFLIFSFIGTSASFLAYSIFAAKRQLVTEARGRKSIYYLGGLTEGFETIVVMILICLFPDHFWWLALVFGILCWITTAGRIAVAWETLYSDASQSAIFSENGDPGGNDYGSG